jgi:hypothetical protein
MFRMTSGVDPATIRDSAVKHTPKKAAGDGKNLGSSDNDLFFPDYLFRL